MTRSLRLFLLLSLIILAGCNTHRVPTAQIDRSVVPQDIEAEPDPEAAEAEEEWTPPERSLMADIPTAYHDAVRAQFGEALETTPILDWFDHGMDAYRASNYKEAERSFKKVLDAMPDFLPVQYNLALVYYYDQRYREAINAFETLLQKMEKIGVDDVSLLLNPDMQQDAQINLGMSYHEAGDNEKAIPMLMKAMPHEVAHYDLVVIYHSMGNQEKVLELTQQYFDTYSEDPELRNLQGLALFEQGKHEEALEAFQTALLGAPDNAQIQVNVGLLYMRLNQHMEAKAAFQQAKEIDPELDVDQYIVALGGIDKRQARIHYNQAVDFHRLGQTNAAITEWRKAIELYPEFTEARINIAAAYSSQRQYAEAIEHLEQAAKSAPKSFEAHYNLGQLYSVMRRYPDAIKVLQQAVVLRPKHPEAQFNLGMAFYKSQQFEQAIVPLSEASQLKPTWLEPRMNLGLLLGQLKRFDEGIQAFQGLLQYHPRNGDAYYNLGVLHLKKDDKERAIAAFERAIDYDPMNTKAMAMLEQLEQ